MTRIYKVPFATGAASSDIEPLATNAQPDGKVSLETGWTNVYRLPKTNPSRKNVGLAENNGILNEVTAAVGELQLQGGFIKWQSVGGGFNKGAVVYGADMRTLYQSTTDANTTDPDSVGSSGWSKLIKDSTPIGKMELMPFRSTELPAGWYHANGTQYPTSSTVGQALLSLSTGYKEDWGITESGGMINVPNMYHTDGRAYFPRAGETPGEVQEDAIRNITGNVVSSRINIDSTVDGCFNLITRSTDYGTGNSSNRGGFSFDASRVVPTAEENRPLNISFVPAIYLGV